MIKRLPATVYRCEWYLAHGETPQSIAKHASKTFGLDGIDVERPDLATYAYCERVNNRSGYIVLCKEFSPESIDALSGLAHECIHASLSTLHYAGVVLDDLHAEEAVTYLFDHYYMSSLALLTGWQQNQSKQIPDEGWTVKRGPRRTQFTLSCSKD